MNTKFIAEVSSNHHRDLNRCLQFIEAAARIGCDAVKFQLFKIEEMFAPEILRVSELHRKRKAWELPLSYLEDLHLACKDNNIEFSCTPFYLQAVEELEPWVDFYKIASYELLWTELLQACAKTGLPVVISTGMATQKEIDSAMATLQQSGATDITLLHCVSAYPTPVEDCNLAVLDTFRSRYGVKVGWSDHTVSPAVLYRAAFRWNCDVIEFHIDLDKAGEEYGAGHCWLPEQIEPVIKGIRQAHVMDGQPVKRTVPSEKNDRDWRADPADGLRPYKSVREQYAKKQLADKARYQSMTDDVEKGITGGDY